MGVSPPRVRIRAARRSDLPAVMRIYHHYVRTSAVTFDTHPLSAPERRAWWDQFRPRGRHRLYVAERDGEVVGFAGSHRFRDRPAYETTVETTIYLAAGRTGQGIGTRLYEVLFSHLSDEDIHSLVAGYTLPNPATAALHRRFGFRPVGTFRRCGRKLGRFWDVRWVQRPLRGGSAPRRRGNG